MKEIICPYCQKICEYKDDLTAFSGILPRISLGVPGYQCISYGNFEIDHIFTYEDLDKFSLTIINQKGSYDLNNVIIVGAAASFIYGKWYYVRTNYKDCYIDVMKTLNRLKNISAFL